MKKLLILIFISISFASFGQTHIVQKDTIVKVNADSISTPQLRTSLIKFNDGTSMSTASTGSTITASDGVYMDGDTVKLKYTNTLDSALNWVTNDEATIGDLNNNSGITITIDTTESKGTTVIKGSSSTMFTHIRALTNKADIGAFSNKTNIANYINVDTTGINWLHKKIVGPSVSLKSDTSGIYYTSIPDTTLTTPTHLMTEAQVKREIAAGNKWTTTSKGIKYIGSSGDSVTIDNLAGGLKIYKSGKKYFDITNNFNVGIGRNTLDAVGTGTYNVGLGYSSMYNNTGNENIAIGNAAITANRDGSWNIGIGTRSLYAHKTGYNNIALGYYSLTGDTSGYNNVAIGYISLSANKNGFNNTSIGALSLISTVTGNSNIAIGAYSGRYNTFNNRLFINSLDRGNILGDSTKSIIYGYQDDDITKQRLYLNSNVNIAEHLRYKGTYASIFRHRSLGDTTQSIPNGTTPTKVLAFSTNGEQSNCTADKTNDKITITKTGRYMVNLSLSYASGTNAINWTAYIFNGGVECENIHSTGYTATANDKRSTAMSGIINVTSVPCDIDYRVSHSHGSSVDLIMTYVNLNVNYIGD